jgi:hypothetical protein
MSADTNGSGRFRVAAWVLAGLVGAVLILAVGATARPLGALLMLTVMVVVGLAVRRLGGALAGRGDA